MRSPDLMYISAVPMVPGNAVLCPLDEWLGSEGLPPKLGPFKDRHGRTLSFRRAEVGPASFTEKSAIALTKTRINQIAQGQFIASTEGHTIPHTLPIKPMLLSGDRQIEPRVQRITVHIVDAFPRESPDFIAMLATLESIYRMLGMTSDTNQLREVAQDMDCEPSLSIPVKSNSWQGYNVMRIDEKLETKLFNASLFCSPGPNERIKVGDVLQRRVQYFVRGQDALQIVERKIGVVTEIAP